MLASSLPPSFLETYSLSTSSLGCIIIIIIIQFSAILSVFYNFSPDFYPKPKRGRKKWLDEFMFFFSFWEIFFVHMYNILLFGIIIIIIIIQYMDSNFFFFLLINIYVWLGLGDLLSRNPSKIFTSLGQILVCVYNICLYDQIIISCTIPSGSLFLTQYYLFLSSFSANLLYLFIIWLTVLSLYIPYLIFWCA